MTTVEQPYDLRTDAISDGGALMLLRNVSEGRWVNRMYVG